MNITPLGEFDGRRSANELKQSKGWDEGKISYTLR